MVARFRRRFPPAAADLVCAGRALRRFAGGAPLEDSPPAAAGSDADGDAGGGRRRAPAASSAAEVGSEELCGFGGGGARSGADAAGEARGRAFGQAHVDVGGARRARVGEHARERRATWRAGAWRRRSRRAGRCASPASAPWSRCTRVRPPRPAGRARRRARPGRRAARRRARAARRQPVAELFSPPASAGSEPRSSAGPSTTPSAATAVRAPPTVSAATGGCSITRMCRPWGKLAVARTSRTTRYGATAARSAPVRTSSVLIRRAARAQGGVDRLRLGAVHAADLHVLDGHERGVRAATASRRRAAASARRGRPAARSAGAGGARRAAAAPTSRQAPSSSAARRRRCARGARPRSRAVARAVRAGAARAAGTARRGVEQAADSGAAGKRAIHRPCLRPPRRNPYISRAQRPLRPGKAHVAERLHLGLELDAEALEHAAAALGHHGEHVGGRRRRRCSR